jgi:two-component system sensor histidine kinase PilS (NtrC family)
MLGRLLLLGLLLMGLLALFPGSEAGFHLFLAIAFVVTIPYALWLRKEGSTLAGGPLQFAVDSLVVTGLVHFTGGINSSLVILYPLLILTAGIVFPGRHALLTAVLGIILYVLLVVLEMQGVLAYCGNGPNPYGDHVHVIRDLMVNVLVFSFFSAAAAFITDRCFWQDKELQRLQSVGKLVFDKVTAPLLAVRPSGEIVLANSAAVRLFGLPGDQGGGRMLGLLFAGDVPDLQAQAGKGGGVWEMRRLDGMSRHCMMEAQRVNMPVANLIPVAKAEADFFFLVFQDVTEFLHRENQRGLQGRLEAAAGLVAEMAHEVRNPLTAIKSAGELLSETAEAVAHERRDMTGTDWGMISSICQVISEETGRLDGKVQELLECAAHNPEKLLELTQNANNWMERLPIYGKRGTDTREDSAG